MVDVERWADPAKRTDGKWTALYAAPQEAAQPVAVCGACGQPWTGEKCGQADNGHPFQTCYPHVEPPPERADVEAMKVMKAALEHIAYPGNYQPGAAPWSIARAALSTVTAKGE